jgi:tRNA (guanosine-2'-O-)-methyltransferase
MADNPRKTIDELSGFITGRRRVLFEHVLNMRTRYITVALEDIYQPHNASAVLRSCECFGIQDVHIIENNNEYRINPEVVMGASKWLNLIRYREKEFNTMEAVRVLREKGYRIIATSPGKGAVPLEEFDVRKGRFALFFGTELTGLTDTVMEEADEFLRIPVRGFTDSFNISVSAAVILHHTRNALDRSGVDWRLSKREQDALMIEWLHRSIKHLRGKSRQHPGNLP